VAGSEGGASDPDCKIQQAMAGSEDGAPALDIKIPHAMLDTTKQHKLVSREENSTESLTVDQRIQQAMQNAVARRRQEAGIPDAPTYDWRDQQMAQTWQDCHKWQQLDPGMQQTFVTQSDGRCAVGFSWEAQSNQWHPDVITPQSSTTQYFNWQNSQYVNWQSQTGQMAACTVQPRPWANLNQGDAAPYEKRQLPAKADEATDVCASPIPIAVPSSQDLRSSWRKQASKRLGESELKVRRPRKSSQNDAHTGASKQKMKEEELDQLGENLMFMYARRRELEEPDPPGSGAKAVGNFVKSVSWADDLDESEGSSPRRAHGGC